MRIKYGITPIRLKLQIVAERHLCSFLSKNMAKIVGNIAAAKKIKAYFEITITIKAMTIAITLISEAANLKLLSESDCDMSILPIKLQRQLLRNIIHMKQVQSFFVPTIKNYRRFFFHCLGS